MAGYIVFVCTAWVSHVHVAFTSKPEISETCPGTGYVMGGGGGLLGQNRFHPVNGWNVTATGTNNQQDLIMCIIGSVLIWRNVTHSCDLMGYMYVMS